MKEVQRRRATRPRTHSQKVALLRVDPSYFKSSAQAVPETHPPLWGHHTDRSAGAAPQCQSLHCTCTPQPSVRPSCGGQLRGPHVRRPHLWRAHLRGPHLRRAHLQRAHLEGPSCRGPHLRRAPSMEGPSLEDPICGGPICRGPHLQRPPSMEAPICHTTEALQWAFPSATSGRYTRFLRDWPHALLCHHPPPQLGEGRTGHAVFHPHTRHPRSLPRPR